MGKDIGQIYERLHNIEESLLTILGSATEPETSHKFEYPVVSAKITDAYKNSNLCKAINESLYTVEMLVTVEGVPSLVKSTFTRVELDDYISRNPGKSLNEYIVSVAPSYRDYL